MHEKLTPVSTPEERMRDENARIEGRITDGYSPTVSERAHLLSARAVGDIVVWTLPAKAAVIHTSPAARASTSKGVNNG